MRRALAGLICVAACASLAGAQGRQLSLADRTLVAQLLRMGDTRTLDTAAFDRGVRASSRVVRGLAILTLGNLGGSEARPRLSVLRRAIEDSDAYVAARAAFALGLLRDTASVPALNDALQRHAVVAQEAAWSLGHIGEPAREAITQTLRSRAIAAAPDELLIAASKLRPVPVDAIIDYLSAPVEVDRWAAAYALSRPRVPAGIRHLLGLAPADEQIGRDARDTTVWYHDPDASHRVTAEVARALTATAAGDSLGDSSFAVLLRLINHPHPHVRINAVRSLATYNRETTAGHVMGVTRDRDANVRIAAAQAFAAMRPRRGTQINWDYLTAHDTTLVYRRAIYEASLVHGGALDWMSQWESHPDWRYRAALASTAHLAIPSVRQSFHSRYLADPEPRVRAAALGSIASDTAVLAERRTVVRTFLGSASVRTRSAAISALARLARADEVPVILDAYAAAARDLDSDARVAAISYVAAAWRRDSVNFGDDLLARLRALRAPSEPVARAVGRNLPFFAHWRATRIRPRPMSWYERVSRDVFERSLSRHPPLATITTARGDIVLELLGTDAPLTVHNFASLARATYYNGVHFHRVVPNFVAQDGDPTGDGNGGPGYVIRDELNPRRYERGIVGMALSGPDTGGSQYFITHSPQPHLDGGYTVFGRVVSGLAVLDQLIQGDRITSVTVR